MTSGVSTAIVAIVLAAASSVAPQPNVTRMDESIAVAPNGHIWYSTFIGGNRLIDRSPDGCQRSYALGMRPSAFGNVAVNGAGTASISDGLLQQAYVVASGRLRTIAFQRRTDTFYLHIVGSRDRTFWLVASHGPLIRYSANRVIEEKMLPDDVATAVATQGTGSGFAFTGRRGIYYFDDSGAFEREPFPDAGKTTSLAIDTDGAAWAIQRRPKPAFYALRYVSSLGSSRLFALPNGFIYPVVVSLPNGNAVVAGDGWMREYSPKSVVWATVVPNRGKVTSLAYDPQLRAVLYITSSDRIGAVDESSNAVPLSSPKKSNSSACALSK